MNRIPMDANPEWLKSVYAPGARVSEDMISVNDSVSLKVFSFTPPVKTDRPDIVFVAGWITQIDSWSEVLQEMTRDHRVHYIETREKISSRVRGKAEYGVEAMGEDVAAITEKLPMAGRPYILFGSSLGATAILDGYEKLRRPPLCLVLIAPNAVFHIPAFWKGVILAFFPPFFFILRPVIKWYLRTFRMNVESDRAQYEKYCRNIDASDPRKLKKAAIALWKYKVWDVLEKVHCPVLIIGGSMDKLHEPENLERMTKMLPHAVYLDMETNRKTHSRQMVMEMRRFVESL